MGNQRRRMILGSGSSSRLPAAYQEVEYLQSTGTQYLRPDYAFNGSKIKIVLDCEVATTSTSEMMLIGNYRFFRVSQKNGKWFVENTRASFLSDSSIVANTNYHLEAEFTTSTISLNVNGATKSTTYSGTTDNLFVPPIFAGVNSADGIINYTTNLKLKHLWRYDDDVLVYELIPCYRKADGVAGMYDVVGNQFYTNAGTGSFTVGPSVDAVYLWNAGDECTSVTGGWSSNGYYYSNGFTIYDGTKNANSMYLDGRGSYKVEVLGVQQGADFTPYSKLCIEYSTTSTQSIVGVVEFPPAHGADLNDNTDGRFNLPPITGTQTQVIDISSYNGVRYLSFNCPNTAARNFTIYKVWLE